MQEVFLQILPFFSIIGLGWLISKFKLANQSWLKPIGDFSFYIGFPALVFANLVELPISKDLLNKGFLFNSGILLGVLSLLLISFLFLKISKSNKATLVICFLFGNMAFMGIPILTAIDPELKQEASLNAAIHLFWVFTLGLFIIEWLTLDKPNVKKILFNLLKNPLLLSVLFGLIFNSLSIPIPKVVIRPIEMLGQTVSPLVMLMIGIFIYAHPVKSLSELKAPFIYSSLKLLIIPLLAYFVFQKLSIEKDGFSMLVDIAMPSAITPFAMADIYGMNKGFISRSIILSTLFSLVTLSIIISILQ